MAATYPSHVIDAGDIPRAFEPAHQHLLDIYVSEINKSASVWRGFDNGVLDYRPHPKSTSVGDIFKHELLAGRRVFGGFLGPPPTAAASRAAAPTAGAAAIGPGPTAVDACVVRRADPGGGRLPHLARATRQWWETPVTFFDVERTRVWVFWRRVLHSAHHRTQLTVYLRLLDRPVPPI